MCREGYLLFLVGVCRRGLREEEEEEEGGCGLGAAPGTAEPAPLLPEPQRSSGGNGLGVKKPHQKVNPSCESRADLERVTAFLGEGRGCSLVMGLYSLPGGS